MTQLTIDNFKTMLTTALANIKMSFPSWMPLLVTVTTDKQS